MDNLNQTLEENMDQINALEAQLSEYNKNIYGLAVEKNAREKEARLLTEQRSETNAKINQNEGREKQIEAKINDLNADAEEQDEVVLDLRKKVVNIDENIKSFEENIKNAASRIGENDAASSKAEEDIHKFDREREVHEKELESITDDIVAALDAGLKEAGYSAAERRNAEAALDESLSRLKAILKARETLLRDLIASAERAAEGGKIPSPKELKNIAGSLTDALAEAASHADKAFTLFESYKKSTPSFIDEFLAPEGIITKKRALDTKIRACREEVAEKRKLIATLRKQSEDLGLKINEYRATLEELRLNRMKMATQAQAAEEQARLIRRELSGQESLLKTIRDELFFDRRRSEEIDERITGVHGEIADIEKKGKELTADLEKLEKDISTKNGDVAGKQETIKKRMTDLARLQESLEKIHLDLVQSETEIKNTEENFRETHSRDLMEFEERIFTITAPPAELREKLAAGRQALRDLGSVNLAAPEEFVEAKERYDFLSGQLADLSKAREDLENLTAEIRAESSTLFLETYNKVKKNFHNMFRRLFGGGRGELRLLDPNHVLESGIEIFAQPPGKKLENINLLSGGERSMTAVALLFATYMVKPSPFCLLDEIDAALDEQNVGRFVQVLKEFGGSSQFIVVTHNKKTVTGSQTLLGITMEESGVSKVISVRLENTGHTGSSARTTSKDGLVKDFQVQGSQGQDSEAEEPPQQELWGDNFKEEDVEIEEGRQLPPGIDDPAKVSKEELRPIRSGRKT
jgi:chromosome segregation protein